MPKITATTFENAARDLGYSRGRAKKYAARIMSHPLLDVIVEQLTLPKWATHPDPTGEEAVWRVMHHALARNELETSS